jgi:exonuclease III
MIKIVSVNVNGIRESRKRRALFEFCRAEKFDITFLQEVHISCGSQIREWSQNFGGQCCWSLGSSRSRGVGILFHPALDVKILNFRHDSEGRLISVNIEYCHQKYRLVNIYCPNEPVERSNFLKDLHLSLQGASNLILGGDFNFVENPKLDKVGGNPIFGCSGTKEISLLKQDFLLVDVFRHKFPNQIQTTWDNGSVFCRLDRFYVSRPLLTNARDIEHSYCSFSDHKFVKLFLQIPDQPILGKSFWKCNVKVLKDQQLKDDLQALFQREDRIADLTPLRWESMKDRIKSILIFHSRRRAKEDRAREIFLERQLAEYRRCQVFLPGAFGEEIQTIKNELRSLIDKRLEGSMIRSRAKFFQDLDHPCSFFLRKEQQHRQKKLISSLRVGDTEVTEAKEILLACQNFYSNLLSEEEIDPALAEYFLKDSPRLTTEQMGLCEGPITKQEILLATKLLKNNKTPGSDGLPKEFYSEFFPLFIDNFTKLVNTYFSENRLGPSQRLGIITLLCKSKDHPELLNNWRPISLLNVDYKIISKVLSLRLGKVLPYIIDVDQTCAVKGRSIQDNVHLLRNVIDYCNGKNTNCMLINLDQSKAFDRVSHQFLFKTLHAFGFGSTFIKWVRILYTSCRSRVEVNGHLSEAFPVTRGVRQGCSLSPLLYVICIEAFARRIRCDPHIRGLRLPTVADELRITQYADDSTLVLTDYHSPRKAFLVAELYGLASGARLNVDKCQGLWLGSWRGNAYRPLSLQWTSDVVKFFGIYLGNGSYEKENENLVFQKFSKTIDLLHSRRLNLITKPEVINLFACSRLWYALSVLPLNPTLNSRLTSYMFRLIWKKSTERVRRSVLYQSFEHGGLRVVDINKKICAYHIRHIFSFLFGKFAKWHSFTEYWIGLSLRRYKSSLWRNDIPHSSEISTFYAEALRVFRLANPDPQRLDGRIPSLKLIYWNLVEQERVTPPHFRHYREIDFAQSMRNIHNKINYPDSREISWQIVHNVLATNDVLYRHHISRSPNCACCPLVETTAHLFLDCWIAKPVWQEIEALLKCFANDKFRLLLDYRAVLFNIIPPPFRKRLNNLAIILINLGKNIIWEVRGLVKFENRHFSSAQISALTLARIRQRIRTDQYLMSVEGFFSLWLRQPSGVRLGADGDIVLCLPRKPTCF